MNVCVGKTCLFTAFVTATVTIRKTLTLFTSVAGVAARAVVMVVQGEEEVLVASAG